MSLFSRRVSNVTGPLIPERPAPRRGTVSVTNETALRHSAVWACLRLRANLVSTMPIDVFRRVNDVQIEVPKPRVLVKPSGERVSMLEWMYSTQFDLDRGGNCFGIITERDGLGLPARIDLAPLSETSVVVKKGVLDKYRIAGQLYDPHDIWHEKQYTVAGLPVGLAPIAYAAWTIGEYLSIQEFALDWFGNGGVPLAHLKNTAKTLNKDEARLVKDRFKASTSSGEPFVSGSDWEYTMIQAEQAGSQWLEAKGFSISDIARFFDCPGDLIDAAVQSGNITYANVTERNMQFLVMHLGPAIVRREDALGDLLSKPRYVKLNTDALLRMDPKTRAQMFQIQIASRQRTPSESRELDNFQPFTETDYAEFDRLFGKPNQKPQTATAVGGDSP